MLKQRVITAVALLALMAVVLGSGSLLAFHLTLAVFFGAACWEALRLFGVRRAVPLAIVAAVLLPWLADRAPSEWVPLAALCVLLWALRFAPALKFGLPPVTGSRGALFTAIYLLALFGCFISIAALWQRSVMFMVSAMAIVWVADIGAYFAGRAIGGPRIAPSISPSKTWAGLGGGIVLAALAEIALFVMTNKGFFDARGAFGSAAFGGAAAVVAQAGDFFESWMKRRAGVKDSGKLIPGHGGLFDRLDGLLAVMFVLGVLSLAIAVWQRL